MSINKHNEMSKISAPQFGVIETILSRILLTFDTLQNIIIVYLKIYII